MNTNDSCIYLIILLNPLGGEISDEDDSRRQPTREDVSLSEDIYLI